MARVFGADDGTLEVKDEKYCIEFTLENNNQQITNEATKEQDSYLDPTPENLTCR